MTETGQVMTKPKVSIVHSVDESGDSYRRMQDAGADVIWGEWPLGRTPGRHPAPEDLIL